MRTLLLRFFLIISFTLIFAGCKKQELEDTSSTLVSSPSQTEEVSVAINDKSNQGLDEILLADTQPSTLDVIDEPATTGAENEIPLLGGGSIFDPNTLARIESQPEELELEGSQNLEVGSELPLTSSSQVPTPISTTPSDVEIKSLESTEPNTAVASTTSVEVTPKQPLPKTGESLNLALIIIVIFCMFGGISLSKFRK